MLGNPDILKNKENILGSTANAFDFAFCRNLLNTTPFVTLKLSAK